VIDHELKNDIAASAFRQRFITLNLNENAAPEAGVMELTDLFSHGSDWSIENSMPGLYAIISA
jgi:hypothetical protein